MLLVATKELGGHYQQTVIAVSGDPTPNGWRVGVILNRPTPMTMGRLFPDFAPALVVKEPVYFGGPAGTNTVVAAYRGEKPDGKAIMAMAEGVYLVIDAEVIDQIIEKTPDAARYYAGLVAWEPGELEAEIKQGMWHTKPLTAEVMFRKDVSGLWLELSATARMKSASWPRSIIAPTATIGIRN
jgi:putative transcriptional regulator